MDVERLREAVKFFGFVYETETRFEPYYIRQSEARNLLAVIEAASALLRIMEWVDDAEQEDNHDEFYACLAQIRKVGDGNI